MYAVLKEDVIVCEVLLYTTRLIQQNIFWLKKHLVQQSVPFKAENKEIAQRARKSYRIS